MTQTAEHKLEWELRYFVAEHLKVSVQQFNKVNYDNMRKIALFICNALKYETPIIANSYLIKFKL
jgi:hypothetical protein